MLTYDEVVIELKKHDFQDYLNQFVKSSIIDGKAEQTSVKISNNYITIEDTINGVLYHGKRPATKEFLAELINHTK